MDDKMTTPQQAYVWVYSIIDSCESKFHFDAADRLIDLFGEKYPDNKEMKIMLIDLRADKHHEKLNPQPPKSSSL